jgi:universal stress protein E
LYDARVKTHSWQTILVAVRDPAARGQMALHAGARLAAASRARLSLFNAFSMPFQPIESTPEDPQALLAAIAAGRRALLLRSARQLKSQGLRVTWEAAWDFPPAHAIVRQALAVKADLIVAESHRRTRLARWALANTDWDLIRESPCPVWLAKRQRHGRRPLVLAAVDPAHAHAKPSGLDDRVLGAANAAARALGGRVALLHVMDLRRLERPAFLKGLPPEDLQPPPAMKARAQSAVRRLARRHGVAKEDVLLRQGVPAVAIAAAAKKLAADVLVMGGVSRSAAEGAYIGDTAELVLDEVACDVLVVKPRGFRTTVRRRRPRLRVT